MNVLIGILEEGLIYALLALGVLITYRVLDFPDLTVDSSFPLGAAVSAILGVAIRSIAGSFARFTNITVLSIAPVFLKSEMKKSASS